MFGFPHSLAVLVASIVASAARADVLVVGTGPSSTHAEIQAAVDAAHDGDFVLVRTGTYASFVVRNLDLTIAAMPGETVAIDGAIRVSGIGATKALLLSGLNATGRFTTNPQSSFGLFARNCAGALRVQDCQFVGGAGQGPCGLRADGVSLENCSDVVFTRCTMVGASQFFDWEPPPQAFPQNHGGSGMGLFAIGSSLALYGSECRGGGGEYAAYYLCSGYGNTGDSGGGGEGARLSGCSLFASLTAFVGGNGAPGQINATACWWGGHGGDGLRLANCPNGMLTGCSATGGSFGQPGGGWSFCNYAHGPNGVGVNAPWPSTPTVLSVPVRQMLAPRAVRDGTTTSIAFAGTTGDRAVLWTSPATSYEPLPWAFGVRIIAPRPPSRALDLGVLSSPGTTTLTWDVPPLPAGVRARRYFIQPGFISTNGEAVLGTPQAIVIIDHTL